MTHQLTDRALDRMVRPWYRGEGFGGDHIFADCEVLEDLELPAIEGIGWLDPAGGDVCETCLERFDPDLYWSLYEEDE
jgi:hypothetical protein